MPLRNALAEDARNRDHAAAADGDAPPAGALRDAGAILLVSCYELGHQPLGLASPLGFLERAGFAPASLDIAVDDLDADKVAAARFIGISVPMHTALRLAVQLLRRVRLLGASCPICVYGLYASLNEDHLFASNVDFVIGGEYETSLVALIEAIDAGRDDAIVEGVSRPGRRARPVLRRLDFVTPSRGGLPAIDRYARIEGGGLDGPAGYVEATRGCLHRCRHCPITPVYGGRFFAVPADIVIEDACRQVELGATHITFGDPDFLNGPRHALRVARALHAELPHVTFDCTIKVEHILKHRDVFPELAALGCVFIVSAFESLDDDVLVYLDKGHTRGDMAAAAAILRAAGISLRPTWVPFTPWTGLDDFIDLIEFVEREDLIEHIAPVQYSIRLLVPPGSALLALPEMQRHTGPLDAEALTYRWTHPDPRVDRLQETIAAEVSAAEARDESVMTTFATVKRLAAKAAGRTSVGEPARPTRKEGPPPRLSEAWFC